MRLVSLLLFTSAAAFSQPFSFGIKGGLPMTDFVDAVNGQNFTASAYTNRYIIGPTAELRLPFGLGVEFDVLYRHFGYSSNGLLSGITTTITNNEHHRQRLGVSASGQVSLQGKDAPPVRERRRFVGQAQRSDAGR